MSELLEMASNQEDNLKFLKETWRVSSIHLMDIYCWRSNDMQQAQNISGRVKSFRSIKVNHRKWLKYKYEYIRSGCKHLKGRCLKIGCLVCLGLVWLFVFLICLFLREVLIRSEVIVLTVLEDIERDSTVDASLLIKETYFWSQKEDGSRIRVQVEETEELRMDSLV